MKDDLISRQAAIGICERAIDLWHGQLGEGILTAVRDSIKDLPPAQMKGAWINEGRIIRCNKCKTGYATVKGMKSALAYNFCPNCGADMRCSENPNR